MYKELIITGASPAYESSLLALLGSLNCNWPGHPPVLVYDLGMSETTLSILDSAGIEVRKVPAFCPHWRSHFTWKPWCFHDAPCESYLWIDSGICVLRPIDEAFVANRKMGYFCVAINELLQPYVNEPLRRALGVTPEEVDTLVSIGSGIHGFYKQGVGEKLVKHALELALIEENMKATEPLHRHDQALLTLLLYKYFSPILYADHHEYCWYEGTHPNYRQKVWAHSRKMLPEDMVYFHQYVGKSGPPYLPRPLPPRQEPSFLMKLRIRIAKLRGRYPGDDRVDNDTTMYNGMRD